MRLSISNCFTAILAMLSPPGQSMGPRSTHCLTQRQGHDRHYGHLAEANHRLTTPNQGNIV
jgi:hypothetical protein